MAQIAVLEYPCGSARQPTTERLAIGHYRLLQLIYQHVKACFLHTSSYNYKPVVSRQEFVHFRSQDDIRSNAWVHDIGTPHELRIVNYSVTSHRPNNSLIGKATHPTTSNGGLALPSITARSAADDFRRAIKRDKSHYDALTKEEDWDSWQNSFVIQAQAHGLENVLDHQYLPFTADEKDLFREQSKFMFSVFRDKIKTDDGCMIVRAHTATLNAQAIYKELCDFHSQSISAKLSAHELVKHLSSAQYDKHWACSSKKFILHWLNTARRYNAMVPPSEQFGDNLLISFLKQSVYNIPELRRVETSQEILESGGVNIVGLAKYKTLLLAAATRYDSTNRPQASPKRVVNASDRSSIDMTASKFVAKTFSKSKFVSEALDPSNNQPNWSTPQHPNCKEPSWSIDMPVSEFIAVNSTSKKIDDRPFPQLGIRAWVPNEIQKHLSDEQRDMIRDHNKQLGFGKNLPKRLTTAQLKQLQVSKTETEPGMFEPAKEMELCRSNNSTHSKLVDKPYGSTWLLEPVKGGNTQSSNSILKHREDSPDFPSPKAKVKQKQGKASFNESKIVPRVLNHSLMEQYGGEEKEVIIKQAKSNNCFKTRKLHQVQDMITNGIISFSHIQGKKNLADDLSKHHISTPTHYIKKHFNWSDNMPDVDYGKIHPKGGVTEV